RVRRDTEELREEKACASVAGGRRESIDKSGGGSYQAGGQAMHGANGRQCQHRRVAAEQLVAAVAAQGHGDQAAGVTGEVHGRKEGGIGERLVEQSADLGEHRGGITSGERELVVLGTEALGDGAGKALLA